MTFGRDELLAIEKLKLRVRQLEADRSEPIAIVGASCRLPGADSPEALWRLLAAGGDAITSHASLDGSPMACGVVEDAESFDAEFFRMSRREVLRMDIRQRFALEASWEALERAGIPATALEGARVGVYIGVSGLSPLAEAEADTHDITGSLPAVVAGRVSYVLGLRGPAMSIDTACSSSLVAVHLACKALRARECVVALAGGVGVLPRSRREQASWLEVGHLGKAGRCRTFDAAADGIVGSDGAVMLVLKRLSAAVKDGDRLLAVIRGSALNHDGRAQGLTVPSGLAQEELLRRALADAHVEASKVGYLECHGTGTPLGDPIEVQAIGKVFGEGGRPSPPLVLGSIKSNIGHTDAAAGAAGVLKVMLAFEHGVIPRTLHFETPNPHIPWDTLPVAVAAEPVAWPRNGTARIAGISSFGISGTNAHVILEDPPAPSGVTATPPARAAELVVVSARGVAALDRAAARLGEHLDAHPEQALGDLAYSLATTRAHHDHRLALAVRTREELRQALAVSARGETPDGGVRAQTRKGKTAWLFTGQGSQTPGMGRELAGAWPAFRAALDGACAALDPHLDRPLRDVMWAAPGTPMAAQLDQTAYTQPALFAFHVALAALWRSWGAEPDLLAGHSIGELSAACIADVFSLEDAARLVAARGRLMQALPAGGAMYAIAAPESAVLAAIEPHAGAVSIAAINAPASVVISGAGAAVAAIAEAFRARGVKTTRLEVSHAFHSALMDGMLDGFREVATSVGYRAPARLVSNRSGKLAGSEVATPEYWVRHVRDAVRFADGVRALDEAGVTRFIELGPRPTLLGLVAACLPERADRPALIASLRARRSEPLAVLEALAGYHAHGGSIAFAAVFPHGGRRVELPTYPWQRQRHAVEAAVAHGPAGEPTGHPLLGVRVSFAGGATVYESLLSRAGHGWLYDHRVAGTAIVPGAGLVELVRAAAEHRFDEPAAVVSLVLQTPLALPESGAVRVQVVVSEDGERTEASVHSQPLHDGASWTLHATAEVRRAPAAAIPSLDLAALRLRCSEAVDVSHIYDRFAATGLEHGPAFRGLRAVWRGSHEALAEIALPDSVDAERFAVHPALLDAAFQATMIGLGTVEGLHLPFAIDRFAVPEPGARSGLAWVRRSKAAEGADGAALDVTLTDRDGRVLVVLDGLHGRRADRLALQGHAEVVANACYRLDWVKAPPLDGGPPTGRWVVVAPDGDPTARAIAQRLASLGVASCACVDAAHLDAALPAEHVVCLWSDPGAARGVAEADAVLQLALAGLAVAQRVQRENVPPRLWWVTERGAAVTERDAPSVASAALWGLGRSVMQELPELACTLVDVPRSPDGAAADLLLRELAGGDDEREVAWRDGGRHVPRLVRAAALDVAPPVWPANASVLVTGGLGALGGHVARWLAGRGVRHLILTGRRGADTPGAAALVAELAALGATVSVVAADAADRSALARIIAAIDRQTPLRGVVHAAGVLDDGVVSEQTAERFATVLAPKLAGALHLDALTRALDLDFFLLFSSTAGTFGAAGQASYAAANAALDALAARRRSEGRTAQSLAWGAWSDGGMASALSSVHRARLERLGMTALSPQQGIALLASVLGRPEAQLVLLPLDLATTRKVLDGAVPPLWRTLIRAPRRAGRRAAAERGAWATSLAQLSPSRRFDAVLEVVRAEVARVLALAGANEVAADRPLQELGIDSLMAIELRNALGKRTGTTLSATLVFDHPSPAAIAKHLLDGVLAAAAPRLAAKPAVRSSDEPIAIVGLGCRYPGGVNDPASFWRLLRDGIDGVIEVPPERWDVDALYDPDPDAVGKTTTRSGGFLSNIDQFDPAFFGIAPREAAAMDPQQRLLLETSWEALEHAGIAPDGLGGSSTGVFVGHMYAEYASLAGNLDQFDGFVGMGTAPSVAAGRISYTLGLQGPSMTVDTACSSSLVTTHLACQALRRGECSLALAGGVTVMLLPAVFVEFSRLRGLSPDGRCKSFSSSSNGVGWGEGCGMLVLERLSDARRNGHRILALVRGSAVNQDGRSNGLTAPNGPSQEAVIRSALDQAGVRPADVQYVECHGTGTSLGDPIEVRALGAVLAEGRDVERPVVIGSVKSNLAHTQAAAGAAGIMKVVLALQNGVIPKNLHFDGPSPHIPWDELPVTVATEAVPWPRNGMRRIAGVSSFGVSGTNAHVVIEEAPAVEARPASSRTPELVLLSARTPAALDAAAARLRSHLEADPEPSLHDIAFSLAVRGRHEHRLALPVATREALAVALEAASRGETPPGCMRGRLRQRKTAWLFTGQGSQVAGMGQGLAAAWPAFRVAIEAAFAALGPHLERLERPLREVMWADPASPAANLLHQTAYTQPALFAFEIALAALWRSWGAEPDFVAGHSIGELSAAYVAGMFSLEDAARLVAARGQLMQQLPRGGAMIAIAASEADVSAAVEPHADRVAVAAINGPRSVVISGAEQDVEAIARRFADQGARTRRLEVSHPFHSPAMEPMLAELRRVAGSVTYRTPERPLISNVTGKPADAAVLEPEYWVRHVRQAVRFADGVMALHGEGVSRFLEIGPRPTLLGLVPGCLPDEDEAGPALHASLRGDRSEPAAVLEAAGAYWADGGVLDATALVPDGRLVDLPAYPWQRQRYWFAEANKPSRVGDSTEHPLLGVHVALAGSRTVYESTMSRREPAWLADHQVAGQAVVPGAALVELVRAAAEHHLAEPAALTSLVFQAPLVVPERGARRVQVIVNEDGERPEVSVYSQAEAAAAGATWTLHATAEVLRGDGVEAPRIDVSAVRRRCTTRVDVAALHGAASEAGLAYGPAFRGLTALWSGSDEALAELRLPETVTDAEHYAVHPALLDAAFQAIAGLDGGEGAHLPFAIDDVRVHHWGARGALAHVRRNEARDGGATLDVTLMDAQGRVLAEVAGLRARRADPAAIHAAETETAAESLYRIEWAVATAADADLPGGRWLVVAPSDHALAAALEHRLRSMGVTSRRVEASQLGEAGPAEQVVCVWPRGADDAAVAAAAEALAVTQALARAEEPPRRLWWVTEGAMAIAAGDVPSVGLASLWGLGRTVAQELPELGLALVDVGAGAGASAVDAVLHELSSRDDEREVAWRDGKRHVARLVRAVATAARARQLRTDGTVLITGGLGGLGVEVARWLAARGVRHLVLTGRRGKDTPGAAATVAELEQLGARVTVAAVDVSNRRALAELLAGVGEAAPLRGVIHAAGVLDDGVIAEQTAERLARVMAPKVLGALHLDALTRAADLDVFVVYSSISGTLGAAGQASYAAANVALEAVAARRRAAGLAGQSLAWGAWAEVGMAAGLESVHRSRLARRGMPAFTVAAGIAAFASALARPDAQLVLVPLDLRAAARSLGPNVPPLFRRLVRVPRRASAATPAWASELASLPPDRRREAVLDVVRAEIARVVVTDPGNVGSDRPLQELGLDSLMAVDLRNSLGKRVGATLPATLAFDYPTPAAIATYLLEKVLRLAATAKPSAPIAPPPADVLTLTTMVELSDDDAVARLQAEITAASSALHDDEGRR